MRYLYIAGKWTEAADDGTSQTLNPYDATVLDRICAALDVGVGDVLEYQPGAAATGDAEDRELTRAA